MRTNEAEKLETVQIPGKLARKLLELPGDAVRLYLYLQAGGGDPENALNLDRSELEGLRAQLVREGFLPSGRTVLPSEPPEYSGSDVTRRMNESGEFRWLFDYVQNLFGRTLSTAESSVLLRIREWMGLEAEVIAVLARYCVEEYREKHGEGRLPSFKYLQNEAVRWSEAGICSAEAADSYLCAQAEKRRLFERIARRINLRDIPESVENHINNWIGMGFDEDAVYRAYDITVLKTGGLKFPYMDTILRNWHEKGLHTVDEITAGDKKPKSPSAPKPRYDKAEAVRRNKSYVKRDEAR